MPETFVSIPTADGLQILGTLNGDESKPLVIFVHGFTGNRNEHFFFNAAKYFLKENFSTFRFDFHPGEDDTRTMVDTTMETYVTDLHAVINHFASSERKVFLVGHSIGGQIISRANPAKVSGVCLWDPSREPKEIVAELRHISGDIYALDWGTTFLIGKNMIESFNALPDLKNIISDFKIPLKVISAANAYGLKAKEKYIDHAASEVKEYVNVEGANHTFDEWGKEEKVFEETVNFFKKL